MSLKGAFFRTMSSGREQPYRGTWKTEDIFIKEGIDDKKIK